MVTQSPAKLPRRKVLILGTCVYCFAEFSAFRPTWTKRPKFCSQRCVNRAHSPDPRKRFFAMADVTLASNGCWPWLGRINPYGYGNTKLGGANVGAHRIAFELFIGPIPPTYQVDHTCHNTDPTCAGGDTCLHRRCVNPLHLEAVTKGQNTMSGKGLAAINRRRTHCVNGHPFSEANTYIDHRLDRNGHVRRCCRTCGRAATQRYLAKKKSTWA